MKKILFLLIVIAISFVISPSFITADFKSEEDKSIDTSKKLLNATVKIEPEPFGQLVSGTGFYIAPNAIVTNDHVIRKASSPKVRITKKDGTTCIGTIGYHEEIIIDLAIINTDCTGIPLAIATSAVEGQTVIVAGNPSNFDFTVSKGIIGAIRSEKIQFDARINFGSSGGVMANLSGDVVGVVVQKSLLDDYIALAIPYNLVKQFIQRSGINSNSIRPMIDTRD